MEASGEAPPADWCPIRSLWLAGGHRGRPCGESAIYDDKKALNSGAVYVFERQFNGAWKQAATLLAPEAIMDSFGVGVALKGQQAYVAESNSGESVHLYASVERCVEVRSEGAAGGVRRSRSVVTSRWLGPPSSTSRCTATTAPASASPATGPTCSVKPLNQLRFNNQTSASEPP